jgi:hypothetical protein
VKKTIVDRPTLPQRKPKKPKSEGKAESPLPAKKLTPSWEKSKERKPLPLPYGERPPGTQKKGNLKMEERELELVGESIWNTYRDMAYLLSEISAGRIEQAVKKQTGRKESRVASRQRQEKATDDRHPQGQVSVLTKGGAARMDAQHATHKAKLDLHRTKEQAARVRRRAKDHPTTESKSSSDGGFSAAAAKSKTSKGAFAVSRKTPKGKKPEGWKPMKADETQHIK